jgi:uncharacterized protein
MMIRRYQGLLLSLWLAIGFAVVVAEEPGHRKYSAKDFFADPEVAELAEAARDGDGKRVDALISQGVNVNSKGKDGWTVLMYSLSGSNLKGSQRLLEQGADPNEQTDNGESAMSLAPHRKNSEVLELLLAHGGDPNLRNKKDSLWPTPIFGAVCSNSVDNARVLIKAGCDLNARDDLGRNTPLIAAARSDSFDVMYVLLEAGADFRLKNSLGYTVTRDLEEPVRDLSLANVPKAERIKSKQKCVQFLEKKGVNFEEERIRNAAIARHIEERRDKKTGTFRGE